MDLSSPHGPPARPVKRKWDGQWLVKMLLAYFIVIQGSWEDRNDDDFDASNRRGLPFDFMLDTPSQEAD